MTTMSTTVVAKALERLLRSVDGVIETHSRDLGPGGDAGRNRAKDFSKESFNSLEDIWVRPTSSASGSGSIASEKDAAVATAWMRAYLEGKVFMRLEMLFITVREQAAVARSRSTARRHAVPTISFAGHAAFSLLQKACTMAERAQVLSRSKADRAVAQEAVTVMAQRGFMLAAANAARSLLAVAAVLRAEAVALRSAGRTGEAEAWMGAYDMLLAITGYAMCRYVLTMAQFVRVPIGGGGGSQPTVPPAVARTVQAMADSELMAAAAVTVLDSCPRDPRLSCPVGLGLNVYDHVRRAIELWSNAMYSFRALTASLANLGGREGRRLAAGLLRAMRHKAVRWLQVVLLDQLAAEAGMGAQLQQQQAEQQEEEDQQQEGSLGGQGAARQGQDLEKPDGWEGSSGTWWFACEEARQGQLLGRNGTHVCTGSGAEARTRTAGWLEDCHCQIVFGTLGDWRAANVQLAAEAGVPTGPPPLLLARLAARAAEALCRLCRGQGLGGAYAPAPEWQLATATVPVIELVATTTEASSLPTATALSCLPYWLEAAGWAVGLRSDAVAAGMGRLPATERKDAESTSDLLENGLSHRRSRAAALVVLLDNLAGLARRDPGGMAGLSATARADVVRRLHRCGLAASLDHTLRLLFSAQEDSRHSEVARDLRAATRAVFLALGLGIVPLTAPAAAPSCSGGGSAGDVPAGDGGSSSSGTEPSSVAGRDQLGLLLTLSKRAAMLARALEAVSVLGGAGQRRQQLLDWAAGVVQTLAEAIRSMQGAVRQRLEQAQAQAAAVQACSGWDGTATARQADAGPFVDEAHEALALAARAASSLAAPLAWQLAADTGAAAAAAAAGGRAAEVLDLLLRGACGVCQLLSFMADSCAHTPLLPPAQLLACQPHRLLAGACALLAALPAGAQLKPQLGGMVANVVVFLAAQLALSSRVRCWLAQVPEAVSASCGSSSSSGKCDVGGSGREQLGALAGCLAAPMQCAVRHSFRLAPGPAARALALMKVAEGEATPSDDGHGGVAHAAHGGFQQYATQLADLARRYQTDLRIPGGMLVVLPDDGPQAMDLAGELGAGDSLLLPLSAPLGPLPPPLALPPSRAGALPRLRVCDNPRCSNFGLECEEALPLKQCGGCRAVRYCGADCQRAHWREGHKAECKALAA